MLGVGKAAERGPPLWVRSMEGLGASRNGKPKTLTWLELLAKRRIP